MSWTPSRCKTADRGWGPNRLPGVPCRRNTGLPSGSPYTWVESRLPSAVRTVYFKIVPCPVRAAGLSSAAALPPACRCRPDNGRDPGCSHSCGRTSSTMSPPALFPAENGPGGGVGRGQAEGGGEGATRVGADPHVEHLFRVPVRPGRRVAGAALHLEAESGDGLPAAVAYHKM